MNGKWQSGLGLSYVFTGMHTHRSGNNPPLRNTGDISLLDPFEVECVVLQLCHIVFWLALLFWACYVSGSLGVLQRQVSSRKKDFELRAGGSVGKGPRT